MVLQQPQQQQNARSCDLRLSASVFMEIFDLWISYVNIRVDAMG